MMILQKIPSGHQILFKKRKKFEVHPINIQGCQLVHSFFEKIRVGIVGMFLKYILYFH